MEQWLNIEGYEGLYQVSNLGRVRSLDRTTTDGRKIKGKILREHTNPLGYQSVVLSSNKVSNRQRIHRLVANAFIPKIEGKEVVNHIDSDKTNNHVSNLEWCTQQENAIHGKQSTLTTEDVHTILDYHFSGFSDGEISELLDVHRVHINRIVRGTRRYTESLNYMGVQYG